MFRTHRTDDSKPNNPFLFDNLTVQIAQLPPKKRMQIFRALVESDLTQRDVATAATMNSLGKLLEMNAAWEPIFNFTLSHNHDLISASCQAIINEYKNQPLQDRLLSAETYTKKMQTASGRNETAVNNLAQLITRDVAIPYAVIEFVYVTAFQIYSLKDVTTKQQCVLMNQLRSNLTKGAVDIKDAALQEIAAEFFKQFNAIHNSYIDADVKTYIELMTKQTLKLEVENRGLLNKSMRALRVTADTLRSDILSAKPGMLNKSMHEHAQQICSLIDELPTSMHSSSDSAKSTLTNISMIMDQVTAIARGESSVVIRGQSDKNVWQNVLQTLTQAASNEHDSLQALKQAAFSKALK